MNSKKVLYVRPASLHAETNYFTFHKWKFPILHIQNTFLLLHLNKAKHLLYQTFWWVELLEAIHFILGKGYGHWLEISQ